MIPAAPSTMKVRTERTGSTAVLRLEGERFTIEDDTHELHECVESMARSGACNIILDVACLRTIDCCGIGQLVNLYKRVWESGGFLCLVNVDRRPKRLLQMLGLLRLFPVFDSREEAVTACWSASARACTPRSPLGEASVHRPGEGTLQPAF
jgi:anti-sigma B factor antagonist